MSDMNDLKLQGRIVRDAVIKRKNEKQIAYFTIAVNQTRKNADGNFFDEVNYFPCSVFLNSDKFAAYLKKGQPLILEGYLKQIIKEVGTRDDGTKIFNSKTFICTSKIHLIFTGKKEDEADKFPEIPENFIYENDEATEDVFIGDDSPIFQEQ